MAQKIDNTEYDVWYNLRDGTRRHRLATSKAGVQEIISDMHADEDRTQTLAKQFGLQIVDHDHDVEIRRVTTKSEKVQL